MSLEMKGAQSIKGFRESDLDGYGRGGRPRRLKKKIFDNSPPVEQVPRPRAKRMPRPKR
jgi:hypothetical protein